MKIFTETAISTTVLLAVIYGGAKWLAHVRTGQTDIRPFADPVKVACG